MDLNAESMRLERLSVPELQARAYGSTAEQARAHAQALALRVVAERLEHDEAGAESMTISFRAA